MQIMGLEICTARTLMGDVWRFLISNQGVNGDWARFSRQETSILWAIKSAGVRDYVSNGKRLIGNWERVKLEYIVKYNLPAHYVFINNCIIVNHLNGFFNDSI